MLAVNMSIPPTDGRPAIGRAVSIFDYYLNILFKGVKVNGQYYCNVLLSQQMLPAIKRVAKRCLFTKQYVAYGEIGHFVCPVISQSG